MHVAECDALSMSFSADALHVFSTHRDGYHYTASACWIHFDRRIQCIHERIRNC
jgi:hypothetical protein